MHRKPLPPALTESAFHVADARERGVTASRLRATDLRTPYPAVRSLRESTTLRERCHDLLPRLGPLHVFSHVTAARARGFPLPYPGPAEPLHVSCPPPLREPRLPGVIGHRMRLTSAEMSMIAGLPVTSAAETWAQLGSMLCPHGCARPHPVDDRPTERTRSQMLHLDDLIAAADHVLTSGTADLDELAHAATRLKRRGAVDLKTALEYARVGSESPKETETRLVIVRAGLPEPEINWVLRDARGGFVARLDLAYPALRIAIEYDGRHHATAEQFRRDADRWAALEEQGWILIRVLAHHLDDPGRLVIPRIRRALAARR